MTKDFMRQVYLALKNGLGIPVTRAWPQSKPALPACLYSLKACVPKELGGFLAQVEILLRLSQQEQGDDYSSLALSALEPLGFSLQNAQDDVEAETGFFLRRLQVQAALSPGFESQPPLTVSIYISPNWLPFQSVVSTQISPATRETVESMPLDFLGALLMEAAPGPISPVHIHFSFAHQPNSAAMQTAGQAFVNGSQVKLGIFQSGQLLYELDGLITSYVNLPQKTALGLTIRQTSA